MKKMNIKYPTMTLPYEIAGKVFVVETIRSLDEAIDLLCSHLSPEEQQDPFAEDLCPYFGILWPSSIALAKYMEEHESVFKNKRIIELGCGPGLPSLVANHLGAEVLATDFHPEAEEYFLRNCRHSSLEVEFKRLNWRDENTLGKFDIVLGSDILYESRHPLEVAEGLLKYLAPQGQIILSDPGRSYLQSFLDSMKELGVKSTMEIIEIQKEEIFIFSFNEYIE